ncbi:MAG: DUF5011 domain-containing protein, partial [Candidatus Hydrogenedens sp.]|nr:DUF5011 domain-containing protein [Candidatus Hydrogenedens sp.]
VVDTGKPVITLLGASTMTVECKGTFTDPGATTTDCDTNIVVNVSGTVNTNAVGEYTLTYTATDASGNSADPVTRTVQVVDSTKPVITLLGDNPLVVECKSTFTDPGATATDSCDTNVAINVSGTVNKDSVGEYTLTYTAADDAGNTATATRTVQVVDTKPPVITLKGEAKIEINKGETFTDPGATAIDECQGDVQVTVTGTVDTSVAKEYTLTYTAKDASGNTATATRTVIVKDVTKPQPEEGKLTIVPEKVDFGEQPINKSYKRRVLLVNKGNVAVNVTISVEDTASGVFVVKPDSGTLSVGTGETKTIDVVFAPKKAGTYNGKVKLTVNDGVKAEDKYVDIVGEGQKPKRRFIISCSPVDNTTGYAGDILFITLTASAMLFFATRRRAKNQ